MEFRSWFVRSFVRSFVGVRPFFLYCTTVQFCCTCAVRGQIESWERAEEGTCITGKGRRNHSRAPRGRDQRCYEHRPTAFRSKITAPELRIARAPELVYYKWNFVRGSFVRWCPPFLFVLYYCTVLLCCKCVVVLYTAQKRSRATGTTRGTHPRAPQGCEQRGTVLRTKLTASEPRIARAPELVTE